MARAGLAWRRDLPVLKFCFLVFKEDALWRAHSISTGQVAEGLTPEDALNNLTRAIDAEIHLARQFGLSAQEWFDSAQAWLDTRTPEDLECIRMFLDLLGEVEPERNETKAPSGDYVLHTTVVKRAA